VLDFEKVKEAERTQAKTLFVTADHQPTPLALSISSSTNDPTPTTSNTFTTESIDDDKSRLLTVTDKQVIREAIEAATSIEEIRRLQRLLDQGFVPNAKDLERLRGKTKATTTNGLNGSANGAIDDGMDLE